MAREIKFRAWDKRRQVLIGSSYRDNWGCDKDEFWGDIAMIELTGIEDINEDDEYIVEQYTGLKDKNGVEIYEGDVVEFDFWQADDRKVVSVVEFKKAGFTAKGIARGTGGSATVECLNNRCEIIGNIHENKDLLNE